MRAGRKIMDMFVMAWLGVEQWAYLLEVFCCGTNAGIHTRFKDECRWRDHRTAKIDRSD